MIFLFMNTINITLQMAVSKSGAMWRGGGGLRVNNYKNTILVLCSSLYPYFPSGFFSFLQCWPLEKPKEKIIL